MIIDQLFENNKKPLNEVDPHNFDSDEDYYAALNAPAKPRYRGQQSPGVNPDDEAYFREIFRKKREAAKNAEKDGEQGVAEDIDNQLPQDTLDLIDEYIAKVEPGADRNEMIKHVVDGSIHTSELEYALQDGMYESEQLDELSWKDIQRGAKKISKGAQKFTKNVADTGTAIGGAARDVGGAIKQVGKTAIADPVAAAYNTTKSGLNKAADVAANTYNDVKAGAQKVGQGVNTVAQDAGDAGTWAGEKIKQAGRGVANVAGGTAGGIGAVAGGATTGLGRAAASGFNTGVQNVGGDAVDRMQTNIMVRKPTEIEKDIQATQTQLKNLNAELEKASAPQYKKVGSLTGATNLSTGEPYTGDELDAMRAAQNAASVIKRAPQDAADAITKNAAGSMMSPTTATTTSGQPSQVSYGQGFTKPAAPKQTSLPNYGQQTPGYNYTTSVTPTATPAGTRVTAGGPTAAEKAALDKRIAAAAAAQPVAETVKQVKRMMETVTSKADVQRIKDYIDYHMGTNLNENTRIKRNRLLSEVTRLAATRRRDIARRMA